MMKLSVQNMQLVFAAMIPWLLFIPVVFLDMSALDLPVLGTIRIYVVLSWVYYWSIYRPTLFPPAVAFFIGLLQDAMSNAPLGFSSILLIMALLIIRSQRRFLMGQSFLVQWLCFGIVCLAYAALEWSGYSLLKMDWLDPVPFLMDSGVTIILFPLVALLIIGLHRRYIADGKKP